MSARGPKIQARDFTYGLTAERLRELVSYDPATGIFTRRKPKRGFSAGKVVGYTRKDGYYELGIDNRRYLAHRLAWLYVTGRWPVDEIDHVNGAKSDNRFSNLREASHLQNGRNQKRPKNNTSGRKGVHWHKHRRKWQASIRVGVDHIYLGLFHSPDEAHEAYVEAAKRLHGEFARAA